MQRLAGVLFQVQTLDTDLDLFVRHVEQDLALADNRLLELGGGAGKELGFGRDLGMDFHTDHDFPIARRALDEFLRIGCAYVDNRHSRQKSCSF